MKQEMDRRVRKQREAARRTLTGGAAAIMDRVEELFQKQLQQSREEAAQQEHVRQLVQQRLLAQLKELLSTTTPSLQQQQQQPQWEGVVVLARRSSDEYVVWIHLEAPTYHQLLEGCAQKMGIQQEHVVRVFWGDVLVQDGMDVGLVEEKAIRIVHMLPEEKEQLLLHDRNANSPSSRVHILPLSQHAAIAAVAVAPVAAPMSFAPPTAPSVTAIHTTISF